MKFALKEVGQPITSLDAKLSDGWGEDGKERVDLLGDEGTTEEFDRVELEGWKEALRAAIDTLTEREAQVLSLSYGVGGRRRSLHEISTSLDLSKERIRQIKVGALHRLRTNPNTHGLRKILAELP